MECKSVQDNLLAYLDDQVTSQVRAAIQHHLSTCPVCQTELAALRKVQHHLARTLRQTASSIAAPPDAWARFQTQLGERHSPQQRIKQPYMSDRAINNKNKSTIISFPVIAALSAAAAVVIIVGSVLAVMMLNQTGDPGSEVAGLPDSETATPAPDGETETPAAAIDPTPTNPRPQSGGGSDGGEGPYGIENLVQLGTLQSIDPASGLLTLNLVEGDAPVVQIMPFTRIRVEDITWDGAAATIDDLQPGMYLQVELIASQPQPPYAELIIIRRDNVNPFWNEQHTPQAGEMGTFDPATGEFTLGPIVDESFYVDDQTRIIFNDDNLDGTPATISDLRVGIMVDIFAEIGDQMPRRAALVIIQPGSPSDYVENFKGFIGAVEGNTITVETARPPDEGPAFTFDIGPAGYADSQGVSFAVDDRVMFKAYHDQNGQLVVTEIINISTGQWLKLRDANGPLW